MSWKVRSLPQVGKTQNTSGILVGITLENWPLGKMRRGERGEDNIKMNPRKVDSENVMSISGLKCRRK